VFSCTPAPHPTANCSTIRKSLMLSGREISFLARCRTQHYHKSRKSLQIAGLGSPRSVRPWIKLSSVCVKPSLRNYPRCDFVYYFSSSCDDHVSAVDSAIGHPKPDAVFKQVCCILASVVVSLLSVDCIHIERFPSCPLAQQFRLGKGVVLQESRFKTPKPLT
jgi:hypothetical protein